MNTIKKAQTSFSALVLDTWRGYFKKKSDLLSLEQLLAESNHMNSSSSAGVAEES